MEEWSNGTSKCKGLRKGGKNEGIVRYVGDSFIALRQYNDDKARGLSITWNYGGDMIVWLYKNNKLLGYIVWNTKDWTEYESHNRSVLDGVVSIDDFRP